MEARSPRLPPEYLAFVDPTVAAGQYRWAEKPGPRSLDPSNEPQKVAELLARTVPRS